MNRQGRCSGSWRLIAWKPTKSVISSKISGSVQRRLGGTFDYAGKKDRLEEVSRELENPDIWNDPENAQALGRERAGLEGIVDTLDAVSTLLDENAEMLEMAMEEEDEEILESVATELNDAESKVGKLEFQRMFRGEMDANPCYLEIQSGSGGTEAQDWAEM